VAGKRRWAATVPSMPTARVNGITMYYEQHGADEPLLLINGLGATPGTRHSGHSWYRPRACLCAMADGIRKHQLTDSYDAMDSITGLYSCHEDSDLGAR
jgi:hypothetical protein